MNNLQNIEYKLPPIPQSIWDKREEKLQSYKKQREGLQDFVKENLIDGIDFGVTEYDKDGNPKKNAKPTLLKPGAEKISDFMGCKLLIYADHESWEMWGKRAGSVAYEVFIIDNDIFLMLIKFLLEVGMQYERSVVRLFAWGSGRGAADEMEKTYGEGGKPLKGAMNRCIKIAEKRGCVDVVIRTFGLNFRQDEEYGESGKLKGDKGPAGVAKGKTPYDKAPEENKGIFSGIMGIINQREGRVEVFSAQERKDYVKSAHAVVENIDSIRELYNAVKKVADERIARIRQGGEVTP